MTNLKKLWTRSHSPQFKWPYAQKLLVAHWGLR